MAKQRHIGFVIFGACSVLAFKSAMFEPQPLRSAATEERWSTRDREEGDTLGLIHASRYYIYGLGILGLLIVVEDYASERLRKKKLPHMTLQPLAAPTPGSSASDDVSAQPSTTTPPRGS
jgi:hypothetical protein